MPIDSLLMGFSLAAGAATFLSPCSVGLFPAYIGFFLGSEERSPRGPRGTLADGGPGTEARILARAVRGVLLGLLGSLGFFLLFLGTGILVALVGSGFVGPYLRWASLGIGAGIVGLGLAQLAGRALSLPPIMRAPTRRGPLSIFTFGTVYALASLGCTLPIFLSVILASLAAGGVAGTLLVLLSYAAGMALVMVVVTTALAISEEAAVTYIRRIVPHIKVASSSLMIVAGLVVIYFYAVVWR